MIIMVSDKPQTELSEFVAKTLDALGGEGVQSMAIVALCEDGTAQTAYWHMSLRDKAQAEAEIRYDAIDQMLLANKDRYLDDGTED
jgi:hypothetical protein